MMGHNIAPTLNAWHADILGMHSDAKETAAQIGEKLVEVKEDLKHGEFKPWIETNCEFSHDMANKYMKVWTLKSERRSEFDGATSIRDALSKAKPAPKPKPNKKVNETELDRKIAGFLAANEEGADLDTVVTEFKDEAGQNPTNMVRQCLSRLADSKAISMRGGVYYDAAVDVQPEELNKTNKKKYEVLERRLKKEFEHTVSTEAQKRSVAWREQFLDKTLKELKATIKRLELALKRQSREGEGLEPREYKLLLAAITADNLSADKRAEAKHAFDKLNLRPFTKEELEEKKRSAAELERIRASFK